MSRIFACCIPPCCKKSVTISPNSLDDRPARDASSRVASIDMDSLTPISSSRTADEKTAEEDIFHLSLSADSHLNQFTPGGHRLHLTLAPIDENPDLPEERKVDDSATTTGFPKPENFKFNLAHLIQSECRGNLNALGYDFERLPDFDFDADVSVVRNYYLNIYSDLKMAVPSILYEHD
jgi:hypothetical protein